MKIGFTGKWTIAVKLGAVFAVLVLLLTVTGAVGFRGVGQLSAALDHLSGPAWQMAESSLKTTIHVGDQTAAVDEMLLGADPGSIKPRIEAAVAETAAAFERLKATGMLPVDRVDELEKTLDAFGTSRTSLTTLYQEFIRERGAMDENFEAFRRYLLEAEDYDAESDRVAAAAINMREALLSRFYYFNRAVVEGGDKTLRMELRQSEREMGKGLRRFKSSAAFRETYRDGPYAGSTRYDTGNRLFEEHVRLMEAATGKVEEMHAVRQVYSVSAAQLNEQIEAVEAIQRKMVSGIQSRVARAKKTADGTISVVVIVSLITGVVAILFTMRGVVAPIRRVGRRLRDIAEGEGDLRVQLEAKGQDELAELARCFNLFVEKLRSTMQDVAQSTDRLVSESREVFKITRETLDGTESQKRETQQAATAVEEMSATSAEVARHAENAAVLAEKADQAVISGRSLVADNKAAVEALAAKVAEAMQIVDRLDGDAQNIGSILDVIRGLANQTNLLALNAAIEAARAGDLGRGFAVVADEVRSLAGRTQEATQEIDDMISTLQTSATRAVSVMKEGHERVDASVERAEQADSALQSITDAVESITRSNIEIASAAEEQAAVAQEINRSVDSISQVAVKTANGAEQNMEAIQTLGNLAEHLQQLVGRFKI